LAIKLKQSLIVIAIALAAWAIAMDSTPSQTLLTVLAALSATALAAVAHSFKTRFEQ
jgi:hypothetical protein